MQAYLPGVMLLSALIDFLLLWSVCQIYSQPLQLGRLVIAAALGGIHAGWCLLPGFHFLGNILWHLVFLVIKGIVAFQCQWRALRPCGMFLLISMALSGVVSIIGSDSVWTLAVGGGIVGIMCLLLARGGVISEYVPIELLYGQKHLQLTALRDTGNTLRDPLTGRSVLVIGAEAACQLTGLTKEQLSRPVESINAIPGLRLIPYRTIGQPSGFLLALHLQKVKIGNWQGSSLVALAPECVGSESTYQALTGGTV